MADPADTPNASWRTSAPVPLQENKLITVRPSLADEIAWILTKLQVTHATGRRSHLGPVSSAPKAWIRRAGTFWSDGVTEFTELGVLAHQAGAGAELDAERLVAALGALEIKPISDALASERPDQRRAISSRLERLAREPRARARYQRLIAEVGRWATSTMSGLGNQLVDSECTRLREALDQGWPLDLVAPRDALSGVGLNPLALVMAAARRGRLVIAPCYFGGRSHVVDLGDVVCVGYGVARPPIEPAEVELGWVVAAQASVLAHPRRSAILVFLLKQPMGLNELHNASGIPEAEIRRHIGVLTRANLVTDDREKTPNEYSARSEAVEILLNDVSAHLQRSHGRASNRHATTVAASADFETIFTEAPIGILQFDVEGRCLSANRAACGLFGASEADLTQLRAVHLVVDGADADAFTLDEKRRGAAGRREVRLRRRDDGIFWASITVAPVASRGAPRFGYAMIEAIAHRTAAADPVTGLPNRALFMGRLHSVLSTRRRNGDSVIVLMTDLDGFKQVNDSLGHRAGDEVLRRVADRLVGTMRPADIVSRLGGDEFAILLDRCPDYEEAEAIAQRIREAIERPMLLAGQRVQLGVSVGWAEADDGSTDAQRLLEQADVAMYAEKRRRPAIRETTRGADAALPDVLAVKG
jgi:diguanylate cyclase (GGDEF)-like protein/PAS domain S-box-containing protein